jgi:hypothetical protein
LSSAGYAIRSTFHTTFKATPAQLVFGRDMVLPINFVADWGEIERQRQKEMARYNKRVNASRINHDYKVGDKVLLKQPDKHLRKLEAPRTGPHTVISTKNDTVFTFTVTRCIGHAGFKCVMFLFFSQMNYLFLNKNIPL